LSHKINNFKEQNKHKEARIVCEELYNLVAEVYFIDHPLVLDAASLLIKNLICTEEYEIAERYARISYEGLTRPVDNESLEVAEFAELLGRVCYQLICIKRRALISGQPMTPRNATLILMVRSFHYHQFKHYSQCSLYYLLFIRLFYSYIS
jgi:hypothetical protein